MSNKKDNTSQDKSELPERRNLPPKEILSVIEKDLDVRYSELKANKEIRLATLKANEKENQRQFEFYSMELGRQEKQDRFNRAVGYIILITVVIIVLVSLVMALNGNSIALEILKVGSSLIVGAFGGYGVSESKRTRKP